MPIINPPSEMQGNWHTGSYRSLEVKNDDIMLYNGVGPSKSLAIDFEKCENLNTHTYGNTVTVHFDIGYNAQGQSFLVKFTCDVLEKKLTFTDTNGTSQVYEPD